METAFAIHDHANAGLRDTRPSCLNQRWAGSPRTSKIRGAALVIVENYLCVRRDAVVFIAQPSAEAENAR